MVYYDNSEYSTLDRYVLSALKVWCESANIEFKVNNMENNDFIDFIFYLCCQYATGKTTKQFLDRALEIKVGNNNKWSNHQKICIRNTYSNIEKAMDRNRYYQ